MATHLLSEGYKDAAAVIAGSTLEEHLRQLAGKHSVTTEHAQKGRTVPKKADRLNADLAKAAAYKKLDHKNITSWLNLRNDAAHGQYEEYSQVQVELMVQGIRDFLARVPVE